MVLRAIAWLHTNLWLGHHLLSLSLDTLDPPRRRKVERSRSWTPHRLIQSWGKQVVLVTPLISVDPCYRMLSPMDIIHLLLQLRFWWAKIKDLRTTHETSRRYRSGNVESLGPKISLSLKHVEAHHEKIILTYVDICWQNDTHFVVQYYTCFSSWHHPWCFAPEFSVSA